VGLTKGEWCSSRGEIYISLQPSFIEWKVYPLIHCNTLQHNATHCSILQHTATHCNTLQKMRCLSFDILQHTATHCNTLQHTATQVMSHKVSYSSHLFHHESYSVLQCVLKCVAVYTAPQHKWNTKKCLSQVISLISSVAVRCSVLQCVAGCCSVLQCVAVCCSVLQCVAVCCSVLQCVAVCCSIMQCVALSTTLQHKIHQTVCLLSHLSHNKSHDDSRETLFGVALMLQCVAVCCSVLQCVKR